MAKQILQINFNFDGPRDVAVKTFMPLAKPIADQPGLKWKIWCWNDENREFGLASLEKLLIQYYNYKPEVLYTKVMDNIASFGKQFDDQTLMIVLCL